MTEINYKKKFSLINKNIIIIGGLGLLGKEISKALFDLGANIIIADKINSKIKKETRYNYINLDCFKISQSEKIIKKCTSKFFNANVLINCSYPRTKDWYENNFQKIKLTSYERNISGHLNSHVWFSRIFAEELKKRKKSGVILNFSSIYGILGQDLTIYKKTKMRENMTYSVVKGAIINFTRQMASYYGRYNILTNCICPGGVYGPVQGLSKKQDKVFLKNYTSKVPIKRLAYASEIASATAFMCSDASSYINGTALVIDGGWSII